MQLISGLFFALSLAAAVIWGGQTIDYTWGPALAVLAAALMAAMPWASSGLDRRRSTLWAAATVLAACAWIAWRCWGSPVREFARADALLAGGFLASFLWGLGLVARGPAIRCLTLALGGLSLGNLVLGILQILQPEASWPFVARPNPLPSGFFGHYNHLADFSAVSAAILAACLIWDRESLAWRCWHAIGTTAAGACVLISGSRGGMMALGAAACVLLALSAIIAWRDKRKSFRLLVGASILLPLVAVLAAFPVLRLVEERRGIGDGTARGIADSWSRLVFLGVAAEISLEEGWSGGGSRSYGWKKYSHWSPEAQGSWGQQDDDFVHNELVQTAVEYGWTGALLVGSSLLIVVFAGVAGIVSRAGPEPSDAITCGGLAAMAATLWHSNFSFVTHTIPGAMYLALAAGMALPRGLRAHASAGAAAWAGRLLSVSVALPLGYAGIQASRAFAALWPVWFGPASVTSSSPEDKLERIENAAYLWPSAGITGKAGRLARAVSDSKTLAADEQEWWLRKSAELFGEAAALHPFDPEWELNRANLLSALRRDEEAEESYVRAIQLQGGMEATFHARHYFALHLYRRWYRLWLEERRAEEALAQFIRARDYLVEAQGTGSSGPQAKEATEALKGLEELISFLEGARVVPK